LCRRPPRRLGRPLRRYLRPPLWFHPRLHPFRLRPPWCRRPQRLCLLHQRLTIHRSLRLPTPSWDITPCAMV